MISPEERRTRDRVAAAIATLFVILSILWVAAGAHAATPNPWHSLSRPAVVPGNAHFAFRCNGTDAVYIGASGYDGSVAISVVPNDANCPAR